METKFSAMVAQRAAARTELTKVRSELDEANLRAEEAEMEVERMRATLAQRSQELASKSSDSGQANEELIKLLADRDEVAKLRHKEHEQIVTSLEQVIARQRADLLAAQTTSASSEQALRQELRIKDRYAQGQIAERDAVINDLTTRLATAKAEIAAARQVVSAPTDMVPSSELAMLQARLSEAMAMYDSVKEEAEETAAEYQRALRERAASEDARLAAERASRLAAERAAKELEAKLSSAENSLRKARLDHQTQSAEAAKAYEAQISRLDRIVMERDQAIAELQSRESVLRERAVAMSKQIEETVEL